MTWYIGKCLTSINNNVSICLCIFNFFMYYYFSVLYPVDVQGMLHRFNTFCCGYSNVMILFTGSLWVHRNGNETRLVNFWRENLSELLEVFSVGTYVWFMPWYSIREVGMASNLTWKGMASFKDTVDMLHGNDWFWPEFLLLWACQKGEYQEGRWFLSAACA